jgi:hypothetical protein
MSDFLTKKSFGVKPTQPLSDTKDAVIQAYCLVERGIWCCMLKLSYIALSV